MSRLCAEMVKAFLSRTIGGDWPSLCQWRRSARSPRHGHRPIRGRDVLDRVPAQARSRGLLGVKLVISDAHDGIKAAVALEMRELRWQSICRLAQEWAAMEWRPWSTN